MITRSSVLSSDRKRRSGQQLATKLIAQWGLGGSHKFFLLGDTVDNKFTAEFTEQILTLDHRFPEEPTTMVIVIGTQRANAMLHFFAYAALEGRCRIAGFYATRRLNAKERKLCKRVPDASLHEECA
jgi:hypothetical protein